MKKFMWNFFGAADNFDKNSDIGYNKSKFVKTFWYIINPQKREIGFLFPFQIRWGIGSNMQMYFFGYNRLNENEQKTT